MKYDANEFGKHPDVMNKEQFYKLCHVSKKTALYLLKSGLIPSRCTGKRTRCCQIMKSDVIAFMEDRKVNPNKYIPSAIRNKKGKLCNITAGSSL